MITAWGYVRVSGDIQADKGLPVASQREELTRYCEAHGLYLAAVFVDEARTGATDQRREFQRMMELAHHNPRPVDQILIWSWSRFSRDQDDAHFYKASLRRHGVEIIDISGETPAISGMEYIVEAFAHWKDEQRLGEISRDTKRGQQALARLGYVPSGCDPPRGFMVEFQEQLIEGRKRRVRKWAPDPAVWPRVQLAWEMRLQGKSYAAIQEATRLYEGPGCWSTFFGNPIYKGELRFGGTLIPVEAAVTPEQWDQVNRERPHRESGAYARRLNSRFLLSGLLTCARCGYALCGSLSGGQRRNDGYTRAGWDYYICIKAKRGHQCTLPRIGARVLEGAILDTLFSQVLTTENLEAQLAAIDAERDTELPKLERRREDLLRSLGENQRTIARLLDAIERVPESENLLERLRQREADSERLKADLRALEVQLAGPRRDGPGAEELRGQLRVALATGPVGAARDLLRALIAEILVDEETATIRYVPPFF